MASSPPSEVEEGAPLASDHWSPYELRSLWWAHWWRHRQPADVPPITTTTATDAGRSQPQTPLAVDLARTSDHLTAAWLWRWTCALELLDQAIDNPQQHPT